MESDESPTKATKRNGNGKAEAAKAKNGNGTAMAEPIVPIVRAVPKEPQAETLFSLERTADGKRRLIVPFDELAAPPLKSSATACATKPATSADEES